MKRTLKLDRDTLTELTTEELGQAAAGMSGPSCGGTCPVAECLSAHVRTCAGLTNNTCVC